MPRRNIVQIRLSDPEREHAAGEAARAGQRLAEWGRAAVKAVLFQRVVRQLEQVRERLSLAQPHANVTLDSSGVVHYEMDYVEQGKPYVGINDKRGLLEATAEWLIGEAGKEGKQNGN